MARFGRYQKTASGAFRDLDTGRFIPTAEVRRLQEIAKAYGALGRAPGNGLLAAAESISQRYGQDYDETLARLNQWRRDVADALARGEEAPAIPSP